MSEQDKQPLPIELPLPIERISSEERLLEIKRIRGEIKATIESNKRIEALEGEVAELKEQLSILKPHPLCNTSCLLSCSMEADYAEKQYLENQQLQANNHDLREALQEAIGYIPAYTVNESVVSKWRSALTATPAESLQAHDDEVAQCKVDAERYQFVRKLTPREFAEIYDINIKTGVHFDHLISQALKEVK